MITTVVAWIGAASGVFSLFFLVTNEYQKRKDRKRSLKNCCYLVCSELEVAAIEFRKASGSGFPVKLANISTVYRHLLWGTSMLTIDHDLHNKLLLCYWRIDLVKNKAYDSEFYKNAVEYIDKTTDEVFTTKKLKFRKQNQ